MLPRRHRTTELPAPLMAEAVRLLATGRSADRLAAMQLLTRGYLDDEEQRRRALGLPDPDADEDDE